MGLVKIKTALSEARRDLVQATETGLSQGFTSAKTRAVGQSTESDTAQAATAVLSSGGSAWDHGATQTITGSGFGTKSPAAPLIWDNCMHGQALSARWSGGWPDDNATYNPDYRTVTASQPMPHSRTTKYLCACNYRDGLFNQGPNAMFWTNFAITKPQFIFWSYRHRCHTNFDSGDNWKYFWYGTPSSPYNTDPVSEAGWYMEREGGLPAGVGGDMTLNMLDTGQSFRPWNSTDFWGDRHGGPANGCPAEGHKPRGTWVQSEGLFKATAANDGILRQTDDGGLALNYSSTNTVYGGLVHPTDVITNASRNWALGGFTRNYGVNNWRYWCDLYLDKTQARIILGNASTYGTSTIREPQIPTAWSDTNITITVNLGALGAGSTAYIHVVNSAGTFQSNVMGAITLGS